MVDQHPRDRRNMTFSQAEGLEPLPQPLALRELSRQTRNLLWEAFYQEFNKHSHGGGYHSIRHLTGDWSKVMYGYHTHFCHHPPDEYNNDYDAQVDFVKNFILSGEWNEIFDFIQYVLRHQNRPYQFEWKVKNALELGRAAYQLVDDDTTIAPKTSPEEGKAIRQAFEELKTSGLDGGRTHLRNAASELTKGEFASCVRESICAVESVARMLDPKAKTLAPALKALKAKTSIHAALAAGFSNIYGYTSDEKGIRHPMLDNPADVDQEDAVFMIGACASFISYMIGKARSSGLIDT